MAAAAADALNDPAAVSTDPLELSADDDHHHELERGGTASGKIAFSLSHSQNACLTLVRVVPSNTNTGRGR